MSVIRSVVMERRAIQLRVAGQTYKVLSTSDEDELRYLAGLIDERVGQLVPKGRAIPGNAILLAAIALAHDLEEERSIRKALERKTRDILRRVLMRIDHALELDSAVAGQPVD
jgi:cell division protein ZapA